MEYTRRHFISLLGGCAAASIPFGCNRFRKSIGSSTKPNFVIIFTDDQGYEDLSCFGSPNIRTPHVDRMARQGIRLTDFYAASSVCTPSRAALLTGCYSKRVGIDTVFWPKGDQRHANTPDNWKTGLHPDEVTIADMLKPAGYTSACIGKWHLGDQPPFLPTNNGFDYYYGVPYSNDMLPVPPNKRGKPGTKYAAVLRNTTVVEKPIDDMSRLTARYTQESLSFIRSCANENKPFFLYLSHTMPHTPLAPGKLFAGTNERRGAYGEAVEEIDWSTGEILNLLDSLGLAENTIIVFTSDNGPAPTRKIPLGSANPLSGTKFQTLEGGFRVPCVIRWPGRVPAGVVSTAMATTMDLFPTFADLANVPTPQDRVIDGETLRPLLVNPNDPKIEHKPFLYYQMDGSLQAIRSGKWKYHLDVETPEWGDTDVRDALFDLSTDPAETHNLAEAHPDVVNRLSLQARTIDTEIRRNSRPLGHLDSLSNG
ncbi:MAG: sulfatase-like hydrolase/transferase [Chitinivibrionales bacterium]|nr:sulfatase-like hydrolase/transferase [Chitinivibrionales bacterium]MBD3357006.1 sulfatase-like hydrolase/transferase [Chitinivibrionales bacterium]